MQCVTQTGSGKQLASTRPGNISSQCHMHCLSSQTTLVGSVNVSQQVLSMSGFKQVYVMCIV